MPRPHEFVTLDGLRGVAAVAVIFAHLGHTFGVQNVHHATLAVDFFFMLSGFVLTFAYQHRLDEGWSTVAFLQARLIRLYPLYLVGLLLGASFLVAQRRFGNLSASSSGMLLLFVLGLLLVPATPAVHTLWPSLYPYDVPAWSLFYELAANVYHATVLRRRSWRVPAAIALLSGATWLLASLHYRMMAFGIARPHMIFGLPRVLFSYSIGCLLFRAWKRQRHPWRIPPALCAAALLGVLFMPLERGGDLLNGAIITFAFPAIILLGASATGGRALTTVAQVLGTASYAVYVLHVPVAEWTEQILKHVTGIAMDAIAPWGGIGCIVLTVLLAIALDRFYDMPVRGRLRRRLHPTP